MSRFQILALALIGLVGLGVFAVSELEFDEKLQELTLPLQHEDIIRQQAEEKGVPAELIAAVINQESEFRDQTSDAGARGLMQITHPTADTIETLSGGETFVYDDLADPDLNIRYGTFYLRHLLDRFGGNEVAALAAYNAGPENSWISSDMDVDDIPEDFGGGETRDYVVDVLDDRDAYRQKYAAELGL